MINPFTTNIPGHCPGGVCDILVKGSEAIVVLLIVLAFIFGVTLIPQALISLRYLSTENDLETIIIIKS
jgi:hypothetical protein